MCWAGGLLLTFWEKRNDPRHLGFNYRLNTIYAVLFLVSPAEIPFGTWYMSYYAGHVVTLPALAVYGFYTSTAGQKLWQGKLLGDGS